jgi:hypothetical protein
MESVPHTSRHKHISTLPAKLSLMPHYHEKDLFDYVDAVVPLLAVLVAVAVGAIQLYLQKRQFGLAYFQERFDVYATTRQFFVSILDPQGPSDPNVLEDFIEGTAHAEFLFGEDVTELRETIIRTASLLLGSIALSGGVGTTQFLRYRASVEQFFLEADAPELKNDSTWRQQLERMQQAFNRVSTSTFSSMVIGTGFVGLLIGSIPDLMS